MSPFGLCGAGTAWELVHRIRTGSLGAAAAAAAATKCGHETFWTRGDGTAALLEV